MIDEEIFELAMLQTYKQTKKKRFETFCCQKKLKFTVISFFFLSFKRIYSNWRVDQIKLKFQTLNESPIYFSIWKQQRKKNQKRMKSIFYAEHKLLDILHESAIFCMKHKP